MLARKDIWVPQRDMVLVPWWLRDRLIQLLELPLGKFADWLALWHVWSIQGVQHWTTDLEGAHVVNEVLLLLNCFHIVSALFQFLIRLMAGWLVEVCPWWKIALFFEDMAHVLHKSLYPSGLVHSVLFDLTIRLCLLVHGCHMLVLAGWWIIIGPIWNILSV